MRIIVSVLSIILIVSSVAASNEPTSSAFCIVSSSGEPVFIDRRYAGLSEQLQLIASTDVWGQPSSLPTSELVQLRSILEGIYKYREDLREYGPQEPSPKIDRDKHLARSGIMIDIWNDLLKENPALKWIHLYVLASCFGIDDGKEMAMTAAYTIKERAKVKKKTEKETERVDRMI